MDDTTPNQPPRAFSFSKIMMRRFALGVACAIAVICVSFGRAEAAQPVLSVIPSIVQVDLSKAGSKPTYQVVIRNLSDEPVTLTASSLDITGQTSAGDTVFSAPGADTDHDIGSSLSYEPAEFELAAGARQTVQVTINQPELLEPGGHYGAAVFTAGGDTAGGSIGVRQAVSSLLFLTTQQGGVKRIGQPTFTMPRFTWTVPTSTDVIIPNTGNAQIAPSGSLQLIRHGKVIADGSVNPDSNLILAGQSRLFRVPLRQFEGWQWAGRYQAELRLKATADSPEQLQTREIVYVSPWFIVAVLAACGLVIGAGRITARYRLRKRLTS